MGYVISLLVFLLFIRYIKYSIQRGKDKDYNLGDKAIEASVKRKIRSLEKEDIKNKNKSKNKSVNINGKTLILIGILTPIVLLLMFGEPYNPSPGQYHHNSYGDYLMNANIVFYDELQNLRNRARQNNKRFLPRAGEDFTKIQMSFKVIMALGLVTVGLGIYKLNNE